MQRLGFYKDGDEHGQSFGEDDASEADGDPVSKAFSTSYFKPRSLASYESYLSEVNNKGYLDMKEGEEEAWCRRYCVLRDGVLSVHKERPLFDEEEERTSSDARVVIQLDSVASVRTALEFGECAFQMVCPDHVYFFCAGCRQEMQEWLFAFHRSLAVIVARLVECKTPTGGKGRSLSQRRAQMLKELGHGHGRSLSVTRRFRRASNYEGTVQLPGAGGGEPLRGGYKRETWAPSLSQPLPSAVPGRVRSADPNGARGRSVDEGGSGLAALALRNERAAAAEAALRLHQTERVPCSSGWSSNGEALSSSGSSSSDRRERIVKHSSSSFTIITGPEEEGEGPPSELKDLLRSLEDAGSLRLGQTEGPPLVGCRPLRIHVEQSCVAVEDSGQSPPNVVLMDGMVLPSPSPLSSAGGREGRESQFLAFGGEEASGEDGGLMFEMSLDEAELNQLAALSQNGSVRSSPRDGPAIRGLEGGGGALWRPSSSGSLDGGAASASGTGEEGRRVASSSSTFIRSPSKSAVLSSTTTGAGGRMGRPGAKRGRVTWTTGVVSLQGIRENQEDQFQAIDDLNAHLQIDHHEAQGFFAIYDGHCGIMAAEYAKNFLHVYLAQDPSFLSRPEEAMTRTCRRLDQEVLELCHRQGLYCGTTAIMVLIRGRKVMVGNLGDCAAVLCRGRKAVRMSVAHTPGRTDELQRIERANGWVTTETELFMGQLHRMDLSDPTIVKAVEKRVKWVTINRVCGELSVSRSIGDPDFKGFEDEGGGGVPDFPFNFPASHSGVFFADLVIADPEFAEAELAEDDKFLLLACDGFWDVMDSQEAVELSLGFLEGGLSAEEAAAKLGDMALRLGSSDNVTIVIVKLHHGEAEEDEVEGGAERRTRGGSL